MPQHKQTVSEKERKLFCKVFYLDNVALLNVLKSKYKPGMYSTIPAGTMGLLLFALNSVQKWL